jgi:hypothetical protein
MRNTTSIIEQDREQDLLESVTEEEIIFLWRSINANGLSEEEAWNAVVTGLALDRAFAKNKHLKTIDH